MSDNKKTFCIPQEISTTGSPCLGCENKDKKISALAQQVESMRGCLERMKSEAYGEKQWAYIVDQAELALAQTPSHWSRQAEAVGRVIEAAKEVVRADGRRVADIGSYILRLEDALDALEESGE